MKKSYYLDPVELELSLRKTIEKNTHEFIDSKIVPDLYTVVIEESLYEEYGELLRTLGKMLREAIDTWIKDKGYWCDGGVEVVFERGDTDRKGFLIRISYKAVSRKDPGEGGLPPVPPAGPGTGGVAGDAAGGGITGRLIDDATGESFPLSGGEVRIGRGQECGIRVTEGTVSESHARLCTEYGRITLEDLESTNGTRVNLRRIRKAALNHGDKIAFGSARFTFLSKTDDPASGR